MNVSPTPSLCSAAQPLSTIAPSSPSVVSDLARAVLPLEVEHLGDRRRVDPVDDLLAAGREAAVLAQRADRGDARGLRRRPGDRGIDRRPPVLRGDHVRRRDAVVERALGLLPEAVGHDGDGGHEHHADHQRARGTGRAARVAHRVAARELAGRAADRGRRAAQQRRRGAHRARREPQLASRRIGVAQRADGSDLRRPPRRQHAGHQRHQRADRHRHDRRARLEHRARLGQREVERSEDRVEAGGQGEARAEADDRRAEPEGERLDHHRAEHLAARGADHAQHRELARALGDGDRERVEDRERAHEDRHAAEHEQDDLDDPDERLQAVEREAVMGGRGLHLGAVAELGGERLADVRARRARPFRPPGSSRSGPACGTASARSRDRTPRWSRRRAT